MPKPFPILINVEEIALGPVLRKLHEMPGVTSVDLQLGHGGQGPGRDQLQQAARQEKGNNESAVIQLLLQGPRHLNDLVASIGGKKSSFYTVMSKLKKQGVAERGEAKGSWQLTHKARTKLGAVQALPAPPPTLTPIAKHVPSGRAAPGSGNIILRSVLDAGGMTPSDLRKRLGEQGMSPKSISGVLDRARKSELIKKNGEGYELTAKGRKIETGVAAHG